MSVTSPLNVTPARALLLVLILVGLITTWLGSGTLAPYAATHLTPRVHGPCKYLMNLDDPHFRSTYNFLKGAPRSSWESSVVLRRILYPVVAFPLMRTFGYLKGGVATNLLLVALALSAVTWHLVRRYGTRRAVVVTALLSTYPGFAYWGGLPYSYACIVPFTLLAFLGLLELDRLNLTVLRCSVVSLLMGVLFVGYDLFPFFGPSAALVLALRRRFGLMCFSVFLMALPFVVVTWFLQYNFAIDPVNANTTALGTIFQSYLHPGDFKTWLALIADAPRILLHNFLFSNFLLLPVTFLGIYACGRFFKGVALETPELALLLSGLAVFLINNLAPTYSGWQLRGDWIARLYQPMVIALVWYIGRAVAANYAHASQIFMPLAVVLCCVMQSWITISPLLGYSALSDKLYYEFYRHSEPGAFTHNIQLYGARPLGFCKHTDSPDEVENVQATIHP